MIKWLDRRNERNKLSAALGWSLITAGWQLWPEPYIGIGLGAVVLLMVLFRYYKVSFLRSIFVTAVLILIQTMLRFLIVELVF